MVTDVVPLLLRLAGTLEGLGIRYVVGGSLASGVHGELRATNDIDVLVELDLDQVKAFVFALQPSYDIWEDTVRDAVAKGRSFGVLHVESHLKIDFFPSCASLLDLRQMERRRALRLPEDPSQEVYFTSAEDTVLRKLDWYRRSGGVLERQLRDVVGVLKLQRDALDWAYLESTAREAELEDLLDRTLREAGVR